MCSSSGNDIEYRLEKDGSAFVKVSNQFLADILLPSGSKYKKLLKYENLQESYDMVDFIPDDISFLEHKLYTKNIEGLLTISYLSNEEYQKKESLQDFIKSIMKSYNETYAAVIDLMDINSEAGSLFNELKDEYAFLSMDSQIESDYESIEKEFDKIVCKGLATIITKKEPDDDNNKIYEIEFNTDWILNDKHSFVQTFNRNIIKDILANFSEDYDINPYFEDYNSINIIEFNELPIS